MLGPVGAHRFSAFSVGYVGKQEGGFAVVRSMGSMLGWAAGRDWREEVILHGAILGTSFVSIIGLPQHFYCSYFSFLEIDKDNGQIGIYC